MSRFGAPAQAPPWVSHGLVPLINLVIAFVILRGRFFLSPVLRLVATSRTAEVVTAAAVFAVLAVPLVRRGRGRYARVIFLSVSGGDWLMPGTSNVVAANLGLGIISHRMLFGATRHSNPATCYQL